MEKSSTKKKKIEADPKKAASLGRDFEDAGRGSRILPYDDFAQLAADCQDGKNIAMTQLSILRELHLIRKLLEARNG